MRGFVPLVAALVWAGGAAAAGVPEPDGFRMDAYRAPVPDSVHGGRVMHTEALKAMLAAGGAVLIDVLPAPRRPEGMRPDAPWLPVPHRDLPGSVWLPDVGRGTLSPELDAWFRGELSRLTGGDKGRPVVLYCLADCWMSWNAAKRAAGYGYTNVVWYPDGVDGWQAAGLPLAQVSPEAMPSHAAGGQ